MFICFAKVIHGLKEGVGFSSLKDKQEKLWLIWMIHFSCNGDDTKNLQRTSFLQLRIPVPEQAPFIFRVPRKGGLWPDDPCHYISIPMGASKVQHTQPAVSRAGKHTAHPLPCSSSAEAGWFWFHSCPPQAWPDKGFQIHSNDSSQDPGPCCVWWRKRCCTPLLLVKWVLGSGSAAMLSSKWPWGLTIVPLCKMALPSNYCVFLQHYFFLRSSIFWDPVSGLGFLWLRAHLPPTPFFHYLNPRSLCCYTRSHPPGL